jgi:NAD(P)-dependent dehydrogenase (short-subunit alcohol dehydrogenase family)
MQTEMGEFVMAKRLDGKVVILTGTSAGLGKQMAVYLAKEGAKLSMCARRTEKLMETARLCEETGAEVLALTCDVSKYENLQNYVEKTIERFGTVDVLINNASALAARVPFLEEDTEELDRQLHTGLYGYWNLMQLCYPYLKGKSSSIINFTSGVYQVGFEQMAAYVADKAAIRGLSMVVAREWGKDGIRCNTVSPAAMTETIMENLPPEFEEYVVSRSRDNAMGRVGDPYQDIAPVTLFLASDESRWITGQNINVDGGVPELILM